MEEVQERGINSNSQILWYCLASLILGLLVGIIGTAFQIFAIKLSLFRVFLTNYLNIKTGFPLVFSSIMITVPMIIVSIVLVRRFAPEASGSGVQEIEGTLIGQRPLFWRRVLPVKFFSGILSIGSNMVVGREGPTIQIGGSLGKMIGEYGKYASDKQNYLIAGGAAAGLAVAFNAPIAGVLFFIEELREHCKFCFSSFLAVLLSCIVATVVYRSILGQGAIISMPVFSAPPLTTVFLFFFFGIFVGFIGLAFNIKLMGWLNFLDKKSMRYKAGYLVVVSLLVAVCNIYLPEAVGGGYHILGHALNFSLLLHYLFAMLVIRAVLTILCYSTGVPGGIFAPLLAIGALAGLVVAKFLSIIGVPFNIPSDMLAVAGMGGIFAASIRAPMTGILLIIEMTQNYFLILPSMVTCFTAFLVVELTKNPPIYSSLLARTLRLNK